MLLSLLFTIASALAQGAPACKNTEPFPAVISPESLKNYATNGRFEKPEDLLCCLARDKKVELVIMHSSVSAQTSDAKNPRVLAVVRGQDGIESVFSVNSGKAHLAQRDAVEIMVNDDKRGVLNFMDFDFAKGRHVSQNNPEVCMSCHGGGSPNPAGGPHPVFDRFPWPRASGALGEIEDKGGAESPFCPERAKLQTALRGQVRNALESEPRYACLKDKPEMPLFEFDRELNKLNERRIAKVIASTKDYEKFKYALAAVFVCPPLKPEDFFPDKALRGMNQLRNVDARLANISGRDNLKAYLKTRDDEYVRQSLAGDAQYRPGSAPLRARRPLKTGPEADREIQCRPNPAHQNMTARSAERLFPGENANYHRYVADSAANDSDMGAFRFLFESRGIDISDWNMNAPGGYGRTPSFGLFKELMDKENADSPLKQLNGQFGLIKKITQNAVPAFALNPDSVEMKRACEKLKELSFAAFGEKPRTPPAAPVPGSAR